MPWPSMEDIAQFWGDRPNTQYQWDPGTTFTAQKDPSQTYGGQDLWNYGVPTTNPNSPTNELPNPLITPEVIDSAPTMWENWIRNNWIIIAIGVGLLVLSKRWRF